MQKVQHEFNFLNKKNIDIDAIKRKPQPISIWNLISTKAIPFWSHTFRLTFFLPIGWSISETHVLGCKVTASSNSVRFSRPIEILFLSSEIWFWERGKVAIGLIWGIWRTWRISHSTKHYCTMLHYMDWCVVMVVLLIKEHV